MPRTREISNMDDVIDSRDVIARIEELEGEREALANELELLESERTDETDTTKLLKLDEKQLAAEKALVEWDQSSESDELKALQALADEAEGYSPDWKYGVTLIRDSYFEEYAMELAEEIGAIPDNLQWPCTCIDWEQAARELQMDYTAVEFGDVTYWVR